MKLLFLSFYFPPDLCAGSFRANSLLSALKKKTKREDSITILTSKPNRYSEFIENSLGHEIRGNIEIIRIRLPSHKNQFLDQSICFFIYFIKVILHLRGKKYDLVAATSSRLFTAFLAKIVSQWKKIPLYLDVRDIFYDVFKDLSKDSIFKIFLPFIKIIERYSFSGVKKINIVSEGFKSYFKDNYNKVDISTYTNGIDSEFLSYNWSSQKNMRIKVCYAGNIGDGQGLHKILPDLAITFADTHDFYVLGNGGKTKDLKNILTKKQISNVYLMPATNRKNLIKYYDSSDILFLHLNDYPAFRRVLPSKLFEYASTGKPILAGVSGYAQKFIKEEIRNAAIFNPCNLTEAKNVLKNIDLNLTDRSDFIEKYDRNKIMSKLAEDILSVHEEC